MGGEGKGMGLTRSKPVGKVCGGEWGEEVPDVPRSHLGTLSDIHCPLSPTSGSARRGDRDVRGDQV